MPGAGGNELLCGPSRGSARGNGFQTTVLSATALPHSAGTGMWPTSTQNSPHLDRVQDDEAPIPVPTEKYSHGQTFPPGRAASSARADAHTSLSMTTGTPRRCCSSARRGRPCQPRLAESNTTPAEGVEPHTPGRAPWCLRHPVGCQPERAASEPQAPYSSRLQNAFGFQVRTGERCRSDSVATRPGRWRYAGVPMRSNVP